MIKIRNAVVALGAAALIAGAAATPAFAAGPSGTGSVGVSSTVSSALFITLSGVSPSIALNGRVGTTATGSENYQVETNDNYTLTLSPGSSALSGTAGQLSNSQLSVAENGAQGHGFTFSSNTPQTVDTESNVTTDTTFSYAETWSLAIPATQAPGTYSENFSYLALGS